MRRRAWLTLCGCLLAVSAWAQSLQVIELQHRTAEEVIPILQPLLEPGAVLSGQDYKLFARTSSANLAQLRTVLAQIDRQARQLLVSVRRSTRQEIEREQAALSGTVRTDDGAVAINEQPRSDSSVSVHATNADSRTLDTSIASVQVIEGSSAVISTGSSIPVVTVLAAGAGRRPNNRTWIASSTSYRNLASGFMVTPRVRGDTVVLEIEQQDERVNNGNIQTQSLSTQARGRLGEWLELGGMSESAASNSSGVLSRRYATQSDERSIWVKVDETATK